MGLNWGHLAKAGDNFGRDSGLGDAPGIQRAKVKDAGKHPTMCRTAPPNNKELPGPKWQ